MFGIQKDLHRAALGGKFRSHFQIRDDDDDNSDDESQFVSWATVKEVYGENACYKRKRKDGEEATSSNTKRTRLEAEPEAPE